MEVAHEVAEGGEEVSGNEESLMWEGEGVEVVESEGEEGRGGKDG